MEYGKFWSHWWNIFSSTNILFLKSVPVSVFGVLGDSWSKFTFSDDWFDDQTSLIWITGITSGRVPIKTNKKLVVLVYRNPNFCLVLFFQLFVYFCKTKKCLSGYGVLWRSSEELSKIEPIFKFEKRPSLKIPMYKVESSEPIPIRHIYLQLYLMD